MNAAPVSKMLMPQSRANMWLQTKQTARAKWTSSRWQGPQEEAAKGKVGWDSVFSNRRPDGSAIVRGLDCHEGEVLLRATSAEKPTALDSAGFHM